MFLELAKWETDRAALEARANRASEEAVMATKVIPCKLLVAFEGTHFVIFLAKFCAVVCTLKSTDIDSYTCIAQFTSV